MAIAGAYKYLYETIWGVCPRGDFICDIVGKPAIPEKLCKVIAIIEDTTGIPPIVAGPFVVGGSIYIGYEIYKKKYGATDPLDLIRKIIEKEFGIGSIADKLFHSFIAEIEASADAALKEFKVKFSVNAQGMSITEQSNFRQQRKQQIIEQTAAALPMHFQEKKAEFKALAEQLNKLDETSPLPAIGEQAAIPQQASEALHQLIRDIVSPEAVTRRLEY